MGCSSSAQTQVKDCSSRPPSKSPGANGLEKCETDDHLPVTDEKETKSDPPKLGVTENVDLGSDGETLSNKLTEEETEVLVPEITKCALSTCQRVDPEGTEPQPVASEERSESIVPLGQVEARKSQPVEPTEGGGPPFVTEAVTKPPETVWENILQPVEQAKGNALEHPETAEESLTLVTEMVKKLQTSVENPLTEGETREKLEVEMPFESISEDSETKEEETGEPAAVTEIEAANNEE